MPIERRKNAHKLIKRAKAESKDVEELLGRRKLSRAQTKTFFAGIAKAAGSGGMLGIIAAILIFLAAAWLGVL